MVVDDVDDADDDYLCWVVRSSMINHYYCDCDWLHLSQLSYY